MPTTRSSTSSARADAAFEIDPLSAVLHISYGWTLMAGGEIDRGDALIDALLADDPENWIGLFYRVALVTSGPQDHPRVAHALEYGLAYAHADGWTDAETDRMRELFDEYGTAGLTVASYEVTDRRLPGSPMSKWILALSLGQRGRVGELVELTRTWLDERQPMLVWFGAAPSLRGAQRDPRFVAMLEEIGVVTGLPEL